MKTVLFDIKPAAGVTLPAVTLVADSALVMPGRPVFLPDFAERWRADVFIAARISRLGKGLAPKFASRYFDTVTLAMRLVPEDADALLASHGLSTGIDGLFDGAVTLGRFLPSGIVGQGAVMSVGGKEVSVDAAAEELDKAVSAVSNLATLKTGDLIMTCGFTAMDEVRIGDVIEASLCGEPCLKVKIK